ncbi:MAG: APC family permease, partial [Planctomycetes bacterium]|nr:APC family permease [Planctomycetota bacterium]
MNIKELLFGKAKNIFDPETLRNISLVAILAWVGLGADGLSSACYGPEETYKALGQNKFLIIPLIGLMVMTIFVLSMGYSQIVSLFPNGGGGYVVATKLLGRTSGLLTGCSLIVDYILTIAISIASGVDAILSFLPNSYQQYKILFTVIVLVGMVYLNLRGVKETIIILVPIFLAFLLSHIVILAYGVLSNIGNITTITTQSYKTAASTAGALSFVGMLAPLLYAFTAGCGTYTGLEAVSNSMQILREPKVQTARRTMLYMAISLSFISGSLLLCYLAYDIKPVQGKSLNAVLFQTILSDTSIGITIIVLLISEAFLLFVAAQTGFVDGPRVIAQMALDHWLPRRFVHLSNRLVIQDGVLVLSLMALFFIFVTAASVHKLVIIYSTAVFITFCFSQLSMCLHWWKERASSKIWWLKMSVNGIGLLLSGIILASLLTFRFLSGSWLAFMLIGVVMVACILVKRHYLHIQSYFRKFSSVIHDSTLSLSLTKSSKEGEVVSSNRTAILLVSGYNFAGVHLFLTLQRLFPNHFRNFVFVSVGEVDYGKFKGINEIKDLEKYTEES